jgi:hypothetical protein
MRLLSFDPFRGMGLAQHFVKPEHWLRDMQLLRAAMCCCTRNPGR